MDSFVIDTNYFVNQEIKTGFGKTTKEVVEGFIDVSSKINNIEFFIPPSIMLELQEFVLDQDLWKKFISLFTIKTPSINSLNIPASFLQTYVQESRERMYKGLKIAEEKIKDTASFFIGKEHMDGVVLEKTMGPLINNLRDRYRNVTRFRFIDSVADLDLILLAYETKSFIVSSDEGVIRWARMLGVKEQLPNAFRQKLLMYEVSHQRA